jgi:ankyrin repeat protein
MIDEYDKIMDCLTNGTAEEWERLSMQIPDFPHGSDHFIHREWIINAIDCGSLASVKWMLSKKVNLHFIDNEGYSVLHSCIERDNADKYEILQLLIDGGADVNVGNELESMAINSWTPLHLAAARNDLDAIKILLENGADSSLKTIIDNYCNAEQEATILGQNETADFIRNYHTKKKLNNGNRNKPSRKGT